MQDTEFLEAVIKMRRLQKAFFRGDKYVLTHCKEAERTVDRMVAEREQQQEELFDTGDMSP